MVKESKSELLKKIQSDYHKNLRELESKLAAAHNELRQVERGIQHESKKVFGHSNLPELKTKKVELNGSILKLKKEIQRINKERKKRIKKLRKS
ncbi:MAG: hypothetical protein ACFFEN_11480 [Candidatus Thorarchaeota archaeon]